MGVCFLFPDGTAEFHELSPFQCVHPVTRVPTRIKVTEQVATTFAANFCTNFYPLLSTAKIIGVEHMLKGTKFKFIVSTLLAALTVKFPNAAVRKVMPSLWRTHFDLNGLSYSDGKSASAEFMRRNFFKSEEKWTHVCETFGIRRSVRRETKRVYWSGRVDALEAGIIAMYLNDKYEELKRPPAPEFLPKKKIAKKKKFPAQITLTTKLLR